jgi:hypothetical protein
MTTRRAQHHEEMRQAIRVAVTMAAVLALLGAIAVARTWALSMAAVLLVMAALIEVIRMEEGEAEPELEQVADASRPVEASPTVPPPRVAPLPPALPARPDDGRVLVTFRLPACIEAGGASVVGEFNDWSATADPMAREAGGFTASLLLDPGRTYRYRYLLDGDRWENDWSADAYVPNQFGGDDSLLDLTGEPLAAPEGAEHSTASGELVA